MSVVVDAHVHLWDPAARAYPWMDESVAPIQRAFSVDDLRAAMPDEVAGAIVVQAVSDLSETEALLDLTAASDTIIGVVGWVDLRD
ncbi:MAG: amidohydrolase, partial [Candidatus Eremiobacteraeota bacterium]|nr:amidohydrolase [Candidatus Eremiobacteraeota bacterium]